MSGQAVRSRSAKRIHAMSSASVASSGMMQNKTSLRFALHATQS